MLGWIRKLFGGSAPRPADKDQMAPGARKTFAELVIVQIKEDALPQISEITDLALKHCGAPTCVRSDVVIVTFDSKSAQGETRPDSLGFKSKLLGQFSQSTRALYGTTWTVGGNLGNDKRRDYGHLFPGLTAALERLDTLDYGDIQQHSFPNWFGEA